MNLDQGCEIPISICSFIQNKIRCVEEGYIFRTIIPFKKIATQKVGGRNVPRNVPRMSPEEMKNKIVEMIKKYSKVSRKFMAEELEVNENTISRHIKEISYIRYIGKGKNGHWEVV